MRLFYFKEKSTTPLRHGGKIIKKHMFGWKNLFLRIFLLKVYESRYIAYLATSESKRETTN